MRLNEAMETYVRYIAYVEGKSKNTVNSYTKDVGNFISYLKGQDLQNFEEITSSILDDYFNSQLKNYAQTSRNRNIASIRGFCTFISDYLTVDNPAQKLKRFKEGQHLPKVMSEEQVELLLNKEDDSDYEKYISAIYEMIYGSGLRASEACNLELNSLNIVEHNVKILGKGNKERIIPISDVALQRIMDYLPVRDRWNKKRLKRLFVNKQGNPLNRQFIHDHLKKRMLEKGITGDYSTHTLRHSFATHMLTEGANLRTIQELLGHSDISTTQIYTHLDVSNLRAEYDRCMPRK